MIDTLTAIDPGLRGCGVSRWLLQGDYWTLDHASYYRGCPDTSVKNYGAWRAMWDVVFCATAHQRTGILAIEFPQVYALGKSKGDPDDLLQLAAVLGGLTAILGPEAVMVCRPREWKGQVPKDVMVRRIQDGLSDADTLGVHLPSAKSLQHNVWDAVGIGMWAIKQIGGKRYA